MSRFNHIKKIRQNLNDNKPSIGTWIQIPNTSIAEILGHSGYDWVVVDIEHGSIGVHQLPDLFRSVELGGSLPLVRIAEGRTKDCKQALDAGAGGVIVPMIKNATQLKTAGDQCRWPPAGKRGVGFSRANLFGKYFDDYVEEAQSPLLVAQIEHIRAVENLEEILQVEGLDAIMVGPYDLSASLKLTAQFGHEDFQNAMNQIISLCNKYKVPCGDHVVEPDLEKLKMRINEGYRFIAYGTDAVFLYTSSINPFKNISEE